MRNPVLNILTILSLLSLCGVSAFVLTVYFNPDSALNPFPPPTMPAGIVLPTETPTPQSMPPTWTPAPGTASPTTQALAPSSTPLASSTSFVLPTYTPTATATETPTETPTITETPVPPEPTNTKVPTKVPTPVNVDLQVVSLTQGGNASESPVTLDISLKENRTTKVSAKFTNTFTRKMTKIVWTCVGATGVTCKGGTINNASGFSTSLTFSGGGTVTIHVVANYTVPAVPKAFNTSAEINGSGNVKDVDPGNNAQSASFAPLP